MSPSPDPQHYYAPRYWLTWLGVGIIQLIATLPFPIQIGLGKILGTLIFIFSKNRKHITETNIRLCFPELGKQKQDQLIKDTIDANAIGLMETAAAWRLPAENFRSKITVHGLENLEAAKRQGKGVLLVGAHYTTLDMGGVLVSLFSDVDVMYRPHTNPLFDQFMKKSRERFCHKVIDRTDIRSVIKSLKAGDVLWYAPDQDYGRNHSVFAPFFGVEAASIKATARFAKINQSPVIILKHHRNLQNDGYTLSFSAPLENYPSGNDIEDATIINQQLESAIRECPEQYMWVHRRFKTRPLGEQPLYSKE
ncbi:MAG: LpxL/LpxP family Kdo(2)-lipid IV(A) lauroyl/palmitoleoyl acyltransferase [Pseudomonadales bacterium]|nr:LpxL/LpxP family Kdo(2)-lipid IV(A) lauroyl/palmitoleoyl acyltransferase [Pseudomonadales bacterium]